MKMNEQEMKNQQDTTVQQKKGKKKVWLIVVLAIIVFAIIMSVLSATGVLKRPETTEKIEDPVNIVQKDGYTKDDVNFIIEDIEAFTTEFDNNAVAADEKYQNQIIQITGYIQNIDEDILGQKYVTVWAEKDAITLKSTQCYFDDDAVDQITSLNKGDMVTIIGKYKGNQIGVILEKCQVVTE